MRLAAADQAAHRAVEAERHLRAVQMRGAQLAVDHVEADRLGGAQRARLPVERVEQQRAAGDGGDVAHERDAVALDLLHARQRQRAGAHQRREREARVAAAFEIHVRIVLAQRDAHVAHALRRRRHPRRAARAHAAVEGELQDGARRVHDQAHAPRQWRAADAHVRAARQDQPIERDAARAGGVGRARRDREPLVRRGGGVGAGDRVEARDAHEAQHHGLGQRLRARERETELGGGDVELDLRMRHVQEQQCADDHRRQRERGGGGPARGPGRRRRGHPAVAHAQQRGQRAELLQAVRRRHALRMRLGVGQHRLDTRCSQPLEAPREGGRVVLRPAHFQVLGWYSHASSVALPPASIFATRRTRTSPPAPREASGKRISMPRSAG